MHAAPSPPPPSIGKYRVERELGRGASGVVYLAVDEFRGRKVAIKQTHAYLLAEPGPAERHRRLLRNEARLAGRLRHLHIVRLLGADENARQPYLVLEYVEGGVLSRHTRADALLPVMQVLDIAFKCANALEYAQREGLVHRDIKPANPLLTAGGEVKLTDFGAALSLKSEAMQLAGLVGSPAYMSPEQVREQPLTHASDMFSLAVTLYELLTGRHPFAGETDYATLYRIGNDTPAAPSLLRAALPERLDALLLRALEKEPHARFPSWATFAAALLAVQQGLPRLRAQDTEAERFARLRALEFLSAFPDVALWELMCLGRWLRVPAGTVLMREGAPGDSFSLILEGAVLVTRQGWQLSVVGPGVTIGEMTCLRPQARVRTAPPRRATTCFC